MQRPDSRMGHGANRDQYRLRLEMPARQAQVPLLDLAAAERLRQPCFRLCRARAGDEPGSSTPEPMGRCPGGIALLQEREQGVVLKATPGQGWKPRRLVDHEQGPVLVNHVEPERGWRLLPWRTMPGDTLTNPRSVILTGEAPLHLDLAGSQTCRPLFTVGVDMRSREMVDERRQIPADLLPMAAPPVKHSGHALVVDPSRCAT